MNLDLRTYSTFNIGGIAHKVFEIKTREDIEHINSYCEYIQKPLVIIGEGSNSIFSDTTDKYVIGLMKISGLEILNQIDTAVLIKSYAGEMWDDVVAWSVEHGLSGLESLSGIPGTAGAAPIQNIGAYGSDISKSFVEAEVFDRHTKSFYSMNHAQCNFGYRDSIFKKEKDRYIIVSITLKLSTIPATIPEYKDVQEYFIQKQNPQCCHSREESVCCHSREESVCCHSREESVCCHSREGGNPGSQNPHTCHSCINFTPSTKQIRDAILEIRNSKIPDYKKIPNCGSFFKNPVITDEHLVVIQKSFPTIPSFELPGGMYKVFAGWLIEHVDYKSAQTESIIFNETNKLVLLNIKDAPFEDLQTVLTKITELVRDAYNIELEIEPNIFL